MAHKSIPIAEPTGSAPPEPRFDPEASYSVRFTHAVRIRSLTVRAGAEVIVTGAALEAFADASILSVGSA